MRIDAYNAVSQIYGTQSKYKAQAAEKTSRKDQLEISNTGKEYQIAKQAVKNAPDIRADKVADLKARIQSGTYKVSDEDFANKLLEAYDSLI